MHIALHTHCPLAPRKCPSLKRTFLLMPFRKCPLRMPFQICPSSKSSKCPFGNANSNMPFQKCPHQNVFHQIALFQMPFLNLPFIKLPFIKNATFLFPALCFLQGNAQTFCVACWYHRENYNHPPMLQDHANCEMQILNFGWKMFKK